MWTNVWMHIWNVYAFEEIAYTSLASDSYKIQFYSFVCALLIRWIVKKNTNIRFPCKFKASVIVTVTAESSL